LKNKLLEIVMETLNIPHIKHGLCPEYKISLEIARNRPAVE
jgi:hypothetical protein